MKESTDQRRENRNTSKHTITHHHTQKSSQEAGLHTLDSPGVYSSPLLHAYSHCATHRGATPLPRKGKRNVPTIDGARMKTEKKIKKKQSAVDRPPHAHVQINDGRLQTQVTRHAAAQPPHEEEGDETTCQNRTRRNENKSTGEEMSDV